MIFSGARFDVHVLMKAIANQSIKYVKGVENILNIGAESYIFFIIRFNCDACLGEMNGECQCSAYAPLKVIDSFRYIYTYS